MDIPSKTIRPSFAYARMSDKTTYEMLSTGATLEEVIAALCIEKSQLVDRIVQLEAIAPRKLKSQDGTTLVWHCPDDMIPIEEVK